MSDEAYTAVLAALPRLSGDEMRDLLDVLPRVAGEWKSLGGCRVRDWHEGGSAAEVQAPTLDDTTWWASVDLHPFNVDLVDSGEFATERAAQAFCDQTLAAAGVALCGEVVRDG